MKTEKKKIQRNPSVELLRCLAMFFVVLLHVNRYCALQEGQEWSRVLRVLSYWGVDCFIAISGWYGVRFSWKKLIPLVSLMYFYLALDVVLLFVLGVSVSPRERLLAIGNWFGTSYIVLLLISGYLNAAIDSLARSSSNRLLSAWILMSLGVLFSWSPYHLFVPIHAAGVSSCSLFTMIFIYLTARTCRLIFVKRITFRWLVFGLSVLPIWVLLTEGASLITGKTILPCDAYISNLAPYVYIFSVTLLLVFVWYVRISGALGWLVTMIAPSMFSVYLIHETTVLGRYTYTIPYGRLHDGLSCSGLLSVILSASISFFICLAIDLLRRLSFCVIRNRVEYILGKIDNQWQRLLNIYEP